MIKLVQTPGISSLLIFNEQGWLDCRAVSKTGCRLFIADWAMHLHMAGAIPWRDYTYRVTWWAEAYTQSVKFCECCLQHERRFNS
jgi:hypothetical protein